MNLGINFQADDGIELSHFVPSRLDFSSRLKAQVRFNLTRNQLEFATGYGIRGYSNEVRYSVLIYLGDTYSDSGSRSNTYFLTSVGMRIRHVLLMNGFVDYPLSSSYE